ncbi:carbonic anhydrase [Xylariaceae sp. FL0804]|nr:carbonic anhydrase [Xylariaceae sp. FL0804]
MSSKSLAADLLQRNEEYVKTHTGFPPMKEVLPLRIPMLIICCMDARVDPIAALGLKPGVHRNGGGNVEAAIPDLLYLDQLFNFSEVLVLQHTDCGKTLTTDAAVREKLKEQIPDQDAEIENLRFDTFTDPGDHARDGVEIIKRHPLVRKELAASTVGVVYDLQTGKVTRV